jgi:hypothetical protein
MSMSAAFLNTARRLLLPALLALAALLTGNSAATAEPVNRKILAIYDSMFDEAPDATLVHSRAEMPLNHLGYIVDYRDAAKSLPDPDDVANYAAVITWFTYNVSRPSEYMQWARRVAERGVPFIIFGQAGAPATPQYLSTINRVLAPMGIAYTANFVEATSGTTILVSDHSTIGYEHPLDPILPSYPVVRRAAGDANVLLEVQAPARERFVRSALVTAGPMGAFILPGFELSGNSQGQTQWIVNPFAIFRKVLGDRRFPVPDTTTVSGRRLYFSHIDGDGWNDDVDIDRYSHPTAIAAEVAAKELIEPYPDLPVSVGMITSDLDPAFGDGARAAAAARHIFSLPQVEIASHSATSPLIWSYYERYERTEEEKLMAGTSRSSSISWLTTVAGALGIFTTSSDIELNRSLYLAGSRPLPRAYLRDPFSLKREIDGAAEVMNGLAPSGKRALLYTWTGDAKPFAAAVKAARSAGLRNINGGGGRLDPDHPSIGYVSPIGRPVGSERQIYAVDAADSSFTDDASGNLGGFSALETTLEATESPVRLKGIDLYYHMFAAKKPASLKAIRGHLNRFRSANVAAITASQYAAIADGFFSTDLEHTAPMSWSVANRDGLQTLRFDDASGLSLDVRRSVGVVGSTDYQGSLYISLDPAVDNATIALREGPAARDGVSAQLNDSNWLLRNVKREVCRLSYSAHGFGTPQFTWKDVAAGRYHIEAREGEYLVWQADMTASDDNRLKFELPELGIQSLDFIVTCIKPSLEKSS